MSGFKQPLSRQCTSALSLRKFDGGRWLSGQKLAVASANTARLRVVVVLRCCLTRRIKAAILQAEHKLRLAAHEVEDDIAWCRVVAACSALR